MYNVYFIDFVTKMLVIETIIDNLSVILVMYFYTFNIFNRKYKLITFCYK